MLAIGFDCGEAEFAHLVLQLLEGNAALRGRLHVVRVDADDLVHQPTVDDH